MSRWVVVIGAGPAGMAAALEAAQRGCRVTVLDEALYPGGQIYRMAAPSLKVTDYAEPSEVARKKNLLGQFQKMDHAIDYRAGAAVYAVFGNREVHVSQADKTEVLVPDAIVLATGVRESVVPFPGWTLPGVMYAGGAQAILKSQGVLPGRRMVIAGCGPLPMVVTAQMLRAGADIKALAILNPMTRMLQHLGGLWHGRHIVKEGFGYLRDVYRAKVPRLSSYVATRAIGTDKLKAIVLERVDKAGKIIPGSAKEIECDVLALNYGFTANAELAAMSGAKLRYDAAGGGWIADADEFGQTSVDGIFVAGDCAGLRGALIAETEGRIVGAAAASARKADQAIKVSLADAFKQRRQYQAFQKAVRATLQIPPALWGLVTEDTIVCRCENVKFAEISAAFRDGHTSPNAVKRNVRPGMGWCSGRTCLRAIGALAEFHTGTPQVETMTARPMARPVSFNALAHQKRAAS